MIDTLLLLSLMNDIRVKPLKTSSSLTKVAKKRAEYLCSHPFSHEGWLTYETLFQYRGENLATGFNDTNLLLKAWIDSPSHKDNILSINYTYIGMYTKCGIVVQEFGGYSN